MTTRCRLAGLVVAALLPLALPVGTAGADPTPEPSGNPASPGASGPDLPLTVRLTGVRPLAPQPGDVLTVSGTLHNDSLASVGNLDLGLRYRDSRIGSRSEFDNYATTADGPLPSLHAPGATVVLSSPTLAPAATEAFVIRVPVDNLALDRRSWQVYEMGVQVNGTTPTGTQTVGRLRTFLPWAPLGVPGVGLPTQVAWVWPLADTPHRSIGDTWVDDDLATAVAPTGRLGRLLSIGVAAQSQTAPPVRPLTPKERKDHVVRKAPATLKPVPVTWAIDPMLVQDVTGMVKTYTVTSGGHRQPGRGQAAAASWLRSLRSALGGGPVLALPYADPDVVAATRAGMAGEVQVAIHTGETMLDDALGVTPLTYAWPPSGQVDQRTLDTLFAAGVSTVVLDASALPIVGPDPSETPGDHAIVRSRDGNLDALLVDSGLRAVINVGMANKSLQALALQRFLAELLMVQAEAPFDQRALVVAPDHHWAPTGAFAAALLSDTGRVPWVQPVPLTAVADNQVSTKVSRPALAYGPRARAAELPAGYLGEVRTTKGSADAFASILTEPGNNQARDFDEAVLRSLSSTWRTDQTEAQTRLNAVNDALASTRRRVRIATAPQSFVTLTSHSGTVPITVTNELDTPVHVVVGISSQHLKIAGNGRTSEIIPPHRKIPIDVRAAAQTSGVFRLDVTLYTPSGQVYQQVKLFVRSTAYGRLALAITGGATAVLMVAVIVRLTRRAWRARRRTA